MSRILLLASFPLPPSINEQYVADNYTGLRHLSQVAREWREDMIQYLDYGAVHAPFKIVRMDTAAIAEIRLLYAKRSRAKAILAQRHTYRLDILNVFTDERRDGDSGYKITQDAIVDWIALKHEKGMGIIFSDRRIAEGRWRRVVDPLAVPHIEVCLQECDTAWESGDLLSVYQRQLEGKGPERPFWDVSTEETATEPLLVALKKGSAS